MTKPPGRKPRGGTNLSSKSSGNPSRGTGIPRNPRISKYGSPTKGNLPIKVTNNDEERRIIIASLTMQSKTLIGKMWENHDEEEREYLCTAARDAAYLALDGRRVPTETLRGHVRMLYGKGHFRTSADGKATYSYPFYEEFKHWQHLEQEKIKQASQESDEKEESTQDQEGELKIIKETDEEYEEDSAYSPSEATETGSHEIQLEEHDNMERELEQLKTELEENSETLLSGQGEEDEEEKDGHLERIEASFQDAFRNFQNEFDELKRDHLVPTPTSPSTTSPTAAAVTDAMEEIDDKEFMNIDYEEKGDEESFKSAVMTTAPVLATPSPSGINKKKREATGDIKAIQETLRHLTEWKKEQELKMHIDKKERQKKEKDLQDQLNEHKEETVKQQREMEKMKRQIQQKESQIQTLKEELGNIQSNINMDDIRKEAKTIRMKAEKAVAVMTKTQTDMETIGNKLNQKLHATIKRAKDMEGYLNKELNPLANMQLRSFETKMTNSINDKIRETREKMNELLEKRLAILKAHSKTVIDSCKEMLTNTDNIAISNVDAISAEYETARQETVKRFKGQFKTEIQELYGKERNTYVEAVKTSVKIVQEQHKKELEKNMHQHIKQEEQRIENFVVNKSREIAENGSFTETIERNLQEHMQTAREQIESIKMEVQEEKDAQRENLKSYYAVLKKKLAQEKVKSMNAMEAQHDVAMNEYATMVEMEKGIAENRKMEADRVTSTTIKKNEETGTTTLVGTPYDASIANGSPDGDPDDSDDDSSSSDGEFSTTSSKRHGQKKKRLPLSRNNASRVHKLRENLNTFTEKRKFEQYQYQRMTEATADALYRALHRSMTTLYLPLLPIDELKPNGTCIHPADVKILKSMEPNMFETIADALYEKLNILLDPEDKNAREIMDCYRGSRNGYSTLYALMQRNLRRLHLNTVMWSPTPWDVKQSAFEFAGELVTAQKEAREMSSRKYSEDEMKMEFILRSRTLPQFQPITTMILFLFDLFGKDVLKNYGFARLMRFYDMIDGMNKNGNEEISTITDETIHKINEERPEINKFNGKRRYKTEAQCELCKQYGHSIEKDQICYFAGKLYHALKDIGLTRATCIDKDRLSHYSSNAKKYADFNIPKNVNQFIAEHPGAGYENLPIDDLNVLFAHKVMYHSTDFP